MAEPRTLDAFVTRPWHLGRAEWSAVLRRVWEQRSDDDVSTRAAAVAFSALLSIPTLLIAVVSVYGLVSSPAQVAAQAERLGTVLPASAADLVRDQLDALVASNDGALTIGAALGFLGALWSVSGGVNRLRETVNEVYGERDTRPWYVKRAWAALGALGVIAFLVVSIATITVLPAALSLIGVGDTFRIVVLGVRWIVLGSLLVLLLGSLYRLGPKRSAPRLPWLAVGTFVAVVAWVAMSIGFGWYAQNYASYNATYGSLGSVVAVLVWLYLSAYIILMAGELNAELEHQTLADTTVGGEQPFGVRGAHVADTVPEDMQDLVDIDVLDDVNRAGISRRTSAPASPSSGRAPR